MDTTIYRDIFVDHTQEGKYITLPFEVPDEEIETIRIKYGYARRDADWIDTKHGTFKSAPEINIIDIGLIDPHGRQIGASGSNKTEFFVNETQATPGYQPCVIVPGIWQIILGFYKVEQEGVNVSFTIELKAGQARWLKGDLHCHTLASDGVHTVEELGWKAKRNGLDFIAITDHNQMVSRQALPSVPDLTIIPGVEWTHYQGHANFTGVDQPYDEPFMTNTFEEAQARFQSARERGALITINHPYEDCCVFKFDINQLPFDCIEIWNGPMRVSNLMAINLWNNLLSAGMKIPMVGGSDYHYDTPFIFLGGPTTCVYSELVQPSKIIKALRRGHSYVTFAPNGPIAEISAGEAIMGDSVLWDECQLLKVSLDGLNEGDTIQVATAAGSEVLLQAPAPGSFDGYYEVKAPGYARVEVLRSFLPGIPQLPALMTNPIYFDEPDNHS